MKLKNALIIGGIIGTISLGTYYFKDQIIEHFKLTPQTTTTQTVPTAKLETQKKTLETITLASWNIQNFGEKKAKDPQVMSKICEVLTQYDLIAIQEVSNINEEVDEDCKRNANAKTHKNYGLISQALDQCFTDTNTSYDYEFSPQIKDERYLFIYRSDKFTLLETRLIKDEQDKKPLCEQTDADTGRMVRQPFLARFQIETFEFTLMTAHTSPSVNIKELDALDYFYDTEKQKGTKNIIILGDLNADCSYLPKNKPVKLKEKEHLWIIPDSTDTTVSNTDCTYDQIIISQQTQTHFTGKTGVYTNLTKNVSDHYPVWSEFKINN